MFRSLRAAALINKSEVWQVLADASVSKLMSADVVKLVSVGR